MASERWIPVLAAGVGLLGGMAGALVGGWVANEGQQQRFENEQAAETRNLRLNTYAEFLKACESVFFIDESFSSAQVSQLVAELSAVEARASLVTSSRQVGEAARALGRGCRDAGEVQLRRLEDSFIKAAQLEVTGQGDR